MRGEAGGLPASRHGEGSWKLSRANQRIYVEHVNMVKRHVRPNPAKQIRGGILEKEGPIHVSNVALVCSDCGPTRIQHREMAEGKKVRICAKCEKSLDK